MNKTWPFPTTPAALPAVTENPVSEVSPATVGGAAICVIKSGLLDLDDDALLPPPQCPLNPLSPGDDSCEACQ